MTQALDGFTCHICLFDLKGSALSVPFRNSGLKNLILVKMTSINILDLLEVESVFTNMHLEHIVLRAPLDVVMFRSLMK
jgi:hypothetical protein